MKEAISFFLSKNQSLSISLPYFFFFSFFLSLFLSLSLFRFLRNFVLIRPFHLCSNSYDISTANVITF